MLASCQSLRRRQHVIPEPQPSSRGNICQGMPLRSTNRMPVRQARSDTRGLPPMRPWLRYYNTARPHTALGYQAPGLSIRSGVARAALIRSVIVTSTCGCAVWVENAPILAESTGRCMAIWPVLGQVQERVLPSATRRDATEYEKQERARTLTVLLVMREILTTSRRNEELPVRHNTSASEQTVVPSEDATRNGQAEGTARCDRQSGVREQGLPGAHAIRKHFWTGSREQLHPRDDARRRRARRRD